MIAFNRTRERRIAAKVTRADTLETRSRGLLGKSRMDPEEGLWIDPCPMIHTFFMRFSIDVLFLDKGLRVRRVMENLRPWRLSPWVFTAQSVLELPGGKLRGSVVKGDVLEFQHDE
ncbi:MAG: DUF192 domain-containing protein [Elusimicrobiota bacterium]